MLLPEWFSSLLALALSSAIRQVLRPVLVSQLLPSSLSQLAELPLCSKPTPTVLAPVWLRRRRPVKPRAGYSQLS
jgi:hypothetical protein